MYLLLFSICFGHPCGHHHEKITLSMRHWRLSLCMGGAWSADHTPPIQRHIEKRNKYIKQNCPPSWTYLQDYTGMHGQQNIMYCGMPACNQNRVVTNKVRVLRISKFIQCHEVTGKSQDNGPRSR